MTETSTPPRPIPKLDGHVAQKLTVQFSGSVELDRRMDDSLELIEGIALGRDVDLVVTARTISKAFTHALKGEAEDDVVGYQVKLKVVRARPSTREE